MKIGQIGRVPTAVKLSRKRLRRSDRPEEVHPPPRAFCFPGVDVEETKRDLNVGYPLLLRFIEGGGGRKLVVDQVGDVEPVKCCARCADFRGVIDECGEGDVVWGYLELEVGLGIVGTLVLQRTSVVYYSSHNAVIPPTYDESFHHFIIVDVAIGRNAGVVVEAGLVQGSKCNVNEGIVVAKIDQGPGKRGLVC